MASRPPEPGAIDWATRIDELLIWQGEVLDRVEEEFDRIEDLIEIQSRLLSEITGVEVDIKEGLSVQIEMSHEVSAGASTDSPETVRRRVPFDGRITSLIVGWPDGAANLVGAGLDLENVDGRVVEEVFPFNEEDDFVAANDFTTQMSTSIEVESGDVMVANYANNDATQPHFINFIVGLEEDV